MRGRKRIQERETRRARSAKKKFLLKEIQIDVYLVRNGEREDASRHVHV